MNNQIYKLVGEHITKTNIVKEKKIKEKGKEIFILCDKEAHIGTKINQKIKWKEQNS